MLSNAAIKIAARRSGRPWVRPAEGGTGCRAVITEPARAHGLVLERAAFLDVLHRLFVSGSDRSANRCAMNYAIAGVAGPLPYVAAGRAATKAARK
jgi:hypothetical protein